MSTQAIERVQEWEPRSFSGGYRGLQDLADQDFSGVVRATGGTLCMLNGAVVGILGGTIEDFEDADGTAYRSPTPALPLLIVMQEKTDDVRAKYYTEDTPLSKVDSTLSDGGFTGFVELSENVLSGDYYVVYHGGRSMSVAFIGERSQLLTDEEAFQKADDEVGIYEVRPVEIDPIDIPEPEPMDPSGEAAASEPPEEISQTETTEKAPASTTASADVPPSTESTTTSSDSTESPSSSGDSFESKSTASDSQDTTTVSADSTTDDPEPDHDKTESEESADPEPATAEPTEQPADADVSGTETAGSPTGQASTAPSRTTTDSKSSGKSAASSADRTREGTVAEQPTGERSTGTDIGGKRERRQDPSTATNGKAGSPGGQSGDRNQPVSGSAADLETRTIPSLDPERSGNGRNSNSVGTPSSGAVLNKPPTTGQTDQSAANRSAGGSTDTASTRAPETTPQNERASKPRPQKSDTPAESGTASTGERAPELEETIAEQEERIETLESKLADTKREREDLQTERDELQEEVKRLTNELSSLREEQEALQDQLDDVEGHTPERRLGRTEAMDGTNLFVRYDSKGEPTLKTAHESGASRGDVNANLNVESHTQFDREGAVVSGEPFEAFLQSTIEFQFVAWIVRELLFEIRETGHQDALADLYDALPRIDRAELNGAATVEYTEDGQTKRSQESFDIVIRDRMGNPLVVANINDSRQAASDDQMSALVTAATRVAQSTETLAGAMFVTASFFEPGALETAADSTGGGLLSRDKRESFVKISRKQGFHLCLVEARDDQFHMAVPEL